MTILWVLGGIAILVGLFFATAALNGYSSAKYNYEPINFGTIAIHTITLIVFFIGYYGETHNQEGSILIATIVIILVAVFSMSYIEKRTSFEIALLSELLLLIISVGAMFLLLGALGRSDSRGYYYDDDDCYYDDDCY